MREASDQAMSSREERAGGRGGGVPLFRIAGIGIYIDRSWLLIFVLVLWSLSAGYFPHEYPDLSRTSYWSAGLAATLLFFLSILAHELSHSLMAIRSGIRVKSITLFLFGGISQMESDPSRPSTEVKVAIVGPLASLALAGLFWALHAAIPQEAPPLWRGVVRYLAFINAALAVFNLLPGFPLDGGRVFRALAWWKTGSIVRATKLAADTGKGFAVALMALGALQIFAGALLGGLWFIFIGMFLRGMAMAGYESMIIRAALEGVRVDEVMAQDLVSVEPGTSVQELVDRYFLHFGYHGFPVLEGRRVRGVISVVDVRGVPPEKRAVTRVEERMRALEPGICIGPGASLADALEQMAREGVGRLLVMRGEVLDGMITRTGLARFLELRQILEPAALT